MASAAYFRTSSQRHNHMQRFREQKHRRNDQYNTDPQRFPYYNVMQIMQGSF